MLADTSVIEYHPNSFAGDFDDEELDSLWDHLPWDELPDGFTPPPIEESYLHHIREFHGGKPLNAYAGGHYIERFLNFANPYVCPENDKIFNINLTRHWIKDGLDDFHVPFAALAHGNYLCFDYNVMPRPAVFFWYHEIPNEIQHFADNFDDLLASVSAKP